MTRAEFPNSSENITFTYDSTSVTNGKGRLTGRTDPSGSYVFYYDAQGNLNKEEKTVASILYTTQYGYNKDNVLTSITYPTGRTITYVPNEIDRIIRVSTVVNSTPTDLASNINYLPFGGITGLTYGNTLILSHGYDNHYQYRTESITVGSLLNRTYGYDANGNVTSTVDSVEPNGEPLEKQRTYTYESGTNLLAQITGEDPKSFDYDDNANTTQEATRVYVYNASNQLITVSDGQTTIAQYVYNGAGQRIKKILSSGTRIFHYDLRGHIIAETDQDSDMLAEYVYLNDELLAMIRPGENVYYYHNDHLGTPQILTNASGNAVWRATYTPFGEADILLETVENPFRFPGQYYDQETGLHYNYFRYYNPGTGRYVTPDPIGLEGGINLFAYSANNPVNWMDSLGLEFITSEQAQILAKIARTWKDTPFGEVGKGSKKGKLGDCSGSTYYIYNEARFPYDYLRSRYFPESPRFRQAPNNIPQVGDVGWWSTHLVVYDPNAGSGNNVWSARRDEIPYGAYRYQDFEKSFKSPVKWYRYYIPDK